MEQVRRSLADGAARRRGYYLLTPGLAREESEALQVPSPRHCRVKVQNQMQRTSYLLTVFIVLTLSFLLVRQTDFFVHARAAQQKDTRAERYELAKRHFPTVDYNEPVLPDTEENRPKKEKQKRFNDLGNWVSAIPQPYLAENLAVVEGSFNFPALPVEKSEIILIGVVGETKARLSENKRNVFSEFMVAVEKVFKTNNQEVRQSSVVTVNRMGGLVKYSNGQTILHRRSGMYMPKIGGRYLFFLNSLNKHDYEILTAYELTEAGVIPLDMASQFFAVEGKTETAILEELRGLITDSN